MRKLFAALCALLTLALAVGGSDAAFAGRPLRGAGSGGGSSATYVASQLAEADTSGDTSVAFATTGVQAGDLLVVTVASGGANLTLQLNGTSTAMDVETEENIGGVFFSVHSKVLQAGDISNGTIGRTAGTLSSGAPVMSAVYRGATTLVVKDMNEGTAGGTSVDLAGFAPDASTRGVLVHVMVGGDSTGNDTNHTPSTLTNYTARIANVQAPSANWWHGSAFDRLSGYTNATVSVTGFASGSFSTTPIGWIGELTP